jgi:NAD(P)-dependent dehydrogenase (short-subunit alcohol dehydrogenase family)
MSENTPTAVLRPGLLEGVSVVCVGAVAPVAASGSPGMLVRGRCAELGASVSSCEVDHHGPPESLEAAVETEIERVLAEIGSIDLLVVDAASFLATAPEADGRGPVDASGVGLGGCLERTWTATRAVLTRGFLPGGRGGRAVYIAPVDDGGVRAAAARAGLENLSRTLSVEWARHAVTVTTIAPGAATAPGEIAEVAAYLASPAGAYFSGCLLELGGV